MSEQTSEQTSLNRRDLLLRSDMYFLIIHVGSERSSRWVFRLSLRPAFFIGAPVNSQRANGADDGAEASREALSELVRRPDKPAARELRRRATDIARPVPAADQNNQRPRRTAIPRLSVRASHRSLVSDQELPRRPLPAHVRPESRRTPARSYFLMA